MLRASPQEEAATIDGLRLFLPRGSSSVLAHRLSALASPQEIELYEYGPLYWRVRQFAQPSAAHLAAWIVARCDAARGANAASCARGDTRGGGSCGAGSYGIGDHPAVLTPGKWSAMQALTQGLETHRHLVASDTQHPLYRTQPERRLVGAELPRIDARLDPRHVYTQVPAFSSGNRGIIDLPGVT